MPRRCRRRSTTVGAPGLAPVAGRPSPEGLPYRVRCNHCCAMISRRPFYSARLRRGVEVGDPLADVLEVLADFHAGQQVGVEGEAAAAMDERDLGMAVDELDQLDALLLRFVVPLQLHEGLGGVATGGGVVDRILLLIAGEDADRAVGVTVGRVESLLVDLSPGQCEEVHAAGGSVRPPEPLVDPESEGGLAGGVFPAAEVAVR